MAYGAIHFFIRTILIQNGAIHDKAISESFKVLIIGKDSDQT
ncbi:hypothetical protein COLO4_32064 [Corchorus olitorius]|uniref:Uncharacterized protein n=1 Tax=Corchorus olitorius TaxID=93759 RepID=A0A1R3H1W0_9ROSI|nr:hypothetical protein COLO4_32064 [Corchorus olitorius]